MGWMGLKFEPQTLLLSLSLFLHGVCDRIRFPATHAGTIYTGIQTQKVNLEAQWIFQSEALTYNCNILLFILSSPMHEIDLVQRHNSHTVLHPPQTHRHMCKIAK